MAATAETVDDPFTAFSFEVVLTLADVAAGVGDPVCRGAFAECDGLSMEMEPRSVLEGGANDSVTHLMGRTRPGQITLRRGMTTTVDLWAWTAAASTPGHDVRADGRITMYDAAHDEQAAFVLTGCLPVSVRGPRLDAHDGLVAIEELSLAVGHLGLEGATPGGGSGIGFSAGIQVGAGIGGAIGVGAAAGAGVQVSGGLGLSGHLGGTLSAGAGGRAGIGFGP